MNERRAEQTLSSALLRVGLNSAGNRLVGIPCGVLDLLSSRLGLNTASQNISGVQAFRDRHVRSPVEGF